MRYAVIAALVTFAIAPAAHAYELDVVNNSRTAIHHLFLSSNDDGEWGPDQLGDGSGDVVGPGETFTLTDIGGGRYDVKIVAEDNTECEVENARFNEGKEWVITEAMLDDCTE